MDINDDMRCGTKRCARTNNTSSLDGFVGFID